MQVALPFCWDVKIRQNEMHIFLEGELTRYTLMPFWNFCQKSKLGEETSKLVWHLDRVHSLDSAGFALLCRFLYAGDQRKVQQIAGCSSQFLTLTDLFGLRFWMEKFLINDKR